MRPQSESVTYSRGVTLRRTDWIIHQPASSIGGLFRVWPGRDLVSPGLGDMFPSWHNVIR